MNEFENLKVGDRVYVENDNCYTSAVVSRITATQIIVKQHGLLTNSDYETKFKKISGRSVNGNTWSRTYLVIPTPELEAKIELEQLTRRVKNMLASCVLPKDKNELLEMKAFLEKYRPVKP